MLYDPTRMRRERHAKLQEQLDGQGLDGLILLGTGNVAYATGATSPAVDSARAAYLRPVAVVRRGADHPELFTPYPDGAPPDVTVHGPLYPDLDDGAAAMADLFPAGSRIGVDEVTHPMDRALAHLDLAPASSVLGPAKLRKTADELGCIAEAQRINEEAMRTVFPLVRPGVRQVELTAAFLRRIVELGAEGNGIDPIWQPMPVSRAAGPWTTHGDIAFPTGRHDLTLAEGDVVWVDTGIHVGGYASDYGRTWICGREPAAQQLDQARRWREVVAAVLDLCKPGVSGLDLTRAAIAANGGTKPWIEHFYLAHGVGTDSAEQPLVGTDLGDGFDEQLVLEPGMVLVLEPVIWDDGSSGYRSEDIVAVTDDGWTPLSDRSYEPFGC